MKNRWSRVGGRRFLWVALLLCLGWGLSPSLAEAQSVEQIILLQPGWNAVFLEVEPHDTECATVFQHLPVESVWLWNPQTSFVEYIQNPAELKPDDPEWLVWFAPSFPDSELLTNLFHIMGERAYLINVSGTAAVLWRIVGTPKLPKIKWIPNSPNLVGFHLMPGQEPSFSDFFTPSNAHGNAAPKVYRLNTAGAWSLTLATAQMQSGEACWVQCDEASDYTGPLSVKVIGDGLDFGVRGVEEKITVQNRTEAAMIVTVTPQASASAGAGMVPLSFWVDPPTSSAGWNIFTGTFSVGYNARTTRDLRFAIRRTALPGPGEYQSLIKITDNAGMQIFVPVTTGEWAATDAKLRTGRTLRNDGPPGYTGLWVGTVSITNVSEPADGSDPDTPKPTASEFMFRLILHVEETTGTVRLLREVAELWKRPVTDEDGNVLEPGRAVLFTDNSLLAAAVESADYTGVGMRDGRPVGRRVSSAVFSFETCDTAEPPVCLPHLVLTERSDGPLSGTYTIGSDDPLNPFVHQYHPDHDNQPYAEAPEITRTITLKLTEDDSTNLNLSQAGWGDTAMGGIYQETLTGVHRSPLYIEGNFRVQKVSEVGILNDEQ